MSRVRARCILDAARAAEALRVSRGVGHSDVARHQAPGNHLHRTVPLPAAGLHRLDGKQYGADLGISDRILPATRWDVDAFAPFRSPARTIRADQPLAASTDAARLAHRIDCRRDDSFYSRSDPGRGG